VDLSRLLLAELDSFGYSRPEHAAFVQCFDATELERVKVELGCELPLIQLVEPGAAHAALLTPAGLDAVARYAHGLGPHYSQLIDGTTKRPRATELGRLARERGLHVHAYTFRRDDLPSYASTLDELLDLAFVDARVDGVFSDHPDVAVRVRDRVAKVQ
jgi:glycerophosphoryl diester phosphodiesterase